MLKTLPYAPLPGVAIQEDSLTAALPSACCPKSKNPQDGSYITVRYKPTVGVLEVAAFYAYLHSYIGGRKDSEGNMIVRDMESMIMYIARDCGHLLQTDVNVEAHILLRPFETKNLKVKYSYHKTLKNRGG